MTAIHFSFNLQKYRKAHNLSQEDLAEKLQVSRQAVAKWEKGANYPDILNLTLLADIFGVTVDALIYGNECTETAGTLPAFPLSSQKLAEFLLSAKKNSYAVNGTEEKQPGPELYRKGEYVYHCSQQGSMQWFQGREEIYYRNQKVYECEFHGGALA